MLFTTLIPVYKTQFLTDTISCLNAQTLKEFSVIFSDDSPGQDLSNVLADIQDDHPITFDYSIIPGPRLGPASNAYHLFAAWQGRSPYIHFLLDDDLLDPDFYRLHALAYQQTNAKSCFSSRRIVSETKRPLETASQAPSTVVSRHSPIELLDFKACATSILPDCNNWLGELSNSTFHGATMGQTVTGQLLHLPYYGLNDLGIFLEMLYKAPAAYIHQALGAFRVNRLQVSGNPRSLVFQSTIISWLSLGLDAWRLKALTPQMCNQLITRIHPSIRQLANSNPELRSLDDLLQQHYLHPHDLDNFAATFTVYWQNQLTHYADYRHAQTLTPRLP